MKKVVLGIISRKNKDGEEEYLLIKAKKDFGKYTGFYYPPGGHAKKGETEKQALIREIKEEINFEAKPIRKIAEAPVDIEGEMASWWLCKIKGGKLKARKEEIADVGYFTQQEMAKMDLWPATRKFFKKYVLK